MFYMMLVVYLYMDWFCVWVEKCCNCCGNIGGLVVVGE